MLLRLAYLDFAECPPRTDLTDATRELYLRQLLVEVADRVRAGRVAGRPDLLSWSP